MRAPGLTPKELIDQGPSIVVTESRTFTPQGLSSDAAGSWLRTPEGLKYLDLLIDSDERASSEKIRGRAIEQIGSGTSIPRFEIIDEPLVKIVPRGDDISAHTPFFARQSAFEDAIASGRNLSDYFGLPIRSEAAVYDIYQIRPRGPTEVFVNNIALA